MQTENAEDKGSWAKCTVDWRLKKLAQGGLKVALDDLWEYLRLANT